MLSIGKLHPLFLHFPIGLVITAAVAECIAILTHQESWRSIGVANLRAGAAMAVVTAIAMLGAVGSYFTAEASVSAVAPHAAGSVAHSAA